MKIQVRGFEDGSAEMRGDAEFHAYLEAAHLLDDMGGNVVPRVQFHLVGETVSVSLTEKGRGDLPATVHGILLGCLKKGVERIEFVGEPISFSDGLKETLDQDLQERCPAGVVITNYNPQK
ncbi:MAG: hypothetical protein HYU04_02005 [Candidatus Wildermuthbacteria bacterium]|nr:hypothetical protein [Candidatus Wildermuthbacteria bacterium]